MSDSGMEKIIPASQVPDELWYKDAVIYELHIKAFFDGNNDGIGDFAGLTQKLDYLQELGVTALWVLPFYPSPQRDDGYDIADYRNVNPSYGTLDEFKLFVEEAHKRGLRIITELVINHTSDQHPWFQRARAAASDSPERNFYVWSESDQKYKGTRIIFSDTEKSNWTWDPVAKSYYWHRFFHHQPDLNYENPEVLKEVLDVMYFWFDMGVDGMRLDAVPYLCEREGTNNENLPETHAVLKKLRAAVDERYPGRMLLAEANQWPEDVMPYFGQGDECHMAFHFPLMPRIYMAVAQEDRHPITDIMYQTPTIPENCQWGFFLRNHDELTLEMVTDRERDYLWNFYAADKRARINFGIRRRLAPLMENDRRKIELLCSLLFSMPGTPILYYGDEIGMGDNIYLGDRDGVRTPMQWSPDRSGGFSRADPERLYLPAIMDPIYGFQSTNVETQRRVQYSLFNWMRKLIAVVKATRVFGRGSLTFLTPSNRAVLAYLRQYEDKNILCVANLSRSPQAVELDLKEFNGLTPVELFGQSRFPNIGELPYLLTLPPFGFYWFQIAKVEEKHEETRRIPEYMTLVMRDGWADLHGKSSLDNLKYRLLPSFIMSRRWFKGKHAGLPGVEVHKIVPVGEDFRLMFITATPPDGELQYYMMGVGILWDDGSGEDPTAKVGSNAICRVRRFNRVGVAYEAMAEPGFIAHLLIGLTQDKPNEPLPPELHFHPLTILPSFKELAIKALGAEQTNTSAMIGDKIIAKFVRQPQPGISLDEEMSRHLTEVARFDRTPAFLGSVYLDSDDKTFPVAVVYEAVENQGDGWKVTLAYLERLIKGADMPSHEHEAKDIAVHEDDYYAKLADRLGQRTGELHKALSLKTGHPGFDPDPVAPGDRKAWIANALGMLDRAFSNTKQVQARLPAETRERVASFIAKRDAFAVQITKILPENIMTPKIRVHGDYHLGQVLQAENDFFIIDFEGEPARTMEERRQKTSPFKDVAGMIRSFDYAAATAFRAASLIAEKDRSSMEQVIRQWAKKSEQAFLEGYRRAIEWSDDEQTQDQVLRFFKLEKVLYEVAYECAHRPDWLDIPLRSALTLIEGDNP